MEELPSLKKEYEKHLTDLQLLYKHLKEELRKKKDPFAERELKRIEFKIQYYEDQIKYC